MAAAMTAAPAPAGAAAVTAAPAGVCGARQFLGVDQPEHLARRLWGRL
jgi:hypothetical protein